MSDVFEMGPAALDFKQEVEDFANAVGATNETEAGAWAEQVVQLHVLACEVVPGALKRISNEKRPLGVWSSARTPRTW